APLPTPVPLPAPSVLDTLLPPGAAATPASTNTIGIAPAGPVPSVVDTLLPPGAAPVSTAAAAPGAQVAIPAAPQKAPVLAPGAVAMPTPDGGVVAVRDKPKTLGRGDSEIELRRLSPEEKARRRFRRNLILGTVCVVILLTVAFVLGWQ
ncbi:MAG: hypothetical protein SFU86_04945, partial [Pirellulaceae bacterium]|nr:hypothetical protein [Pirellulaceae bacterium]